MLIVESLENKQTLIQITLDELCAALSAHNNKYFLLGFLNACKKQFPKHVRAIFIGNTKNPNLDIKIPQYIEFAKHVQQKLIVIADNKRVNILKKSCFCILLNDDLDSIKPITKNEYEDQLMEFKTNISNTTNMHWVASDGETGESSAVACGEQRNSPADIKLVPAIDITQPVAISNELTISDKTKAVSEHIEILKNEQNHIYKKEQAIASLLKLKQSDDSEANSTPLFNKYQRLNKHRLHLRSKVSNLKKELSFLTARDMISHAIDNEVDLITLEKLSWIRDEQHTTWDYSQIQQRIIHEANIYGIKVKKVACAYSSAHNPLTLEKDEVDQNRKLVKCLFDRDYAAAIILARRGVKLGKRKQKLRPVSQVSSNPAAHINESFA